MSSAFAFLVILLSFTGMDLIAAVIDEHHLKFEAPLGTPRGDFGTAVATWENHVFIGSPSVDQL
jgi:hypothetical protein